MSFLEYFEKRQRTYPQNVKGKIRKIKNIANIIFLTLFFALPFVRFDHGEGLPNQAVLIDIVNSRGYFFFIKIWPEEVYYLAGILITAAITLFFVTALFGRVWCGYSCPQTVWTDIFIKVERFFQGDRNERIILDRKNSLKKFILKFLTHFVWILISLATGFGFVLYFNDAFIIVNNLINFNLSFNVIGWILGIAGMTYIMAGFAREQVCNYMCPYARFQSVMFDNDTLIITYDYQRGEPRGKFKQGDSMENRGHCIDCKQCVVVCPQNIDIRNGLQMECIACGLCVDACDNVMERINLPKGLIRYDTENNFKDPSHKNKFRLLRPRTFYYSFVLSIVGGVIIYNLIFKSQSDLKIIPSRNPLFVTLSNGDIRNGYEVKISNKGKKKQDYSLELQGIDKAEVKVQNPTDLNLNDFSVKNDSIQSIKIYVSSNKNGLKNEKGQDEIKFVLTEKNSQTKISRKSVFISK